MACTANLAQIAQIIREHDNFVICGHMSPDGDCLGSQLCLAMALESLGKHALCVFAKDASFDRGLAGLPGIECIVCAVNCDIEPEVFIAVDVPTLDRMGDAAALHTKAHMTITLDHHASKELISDYNYIDSDKAAAAMIIWDLLTYLEVKPSKDMARCAYMGLMTDTGRFQFQNATADTFATAAEMIRAGADAARAAQDFFQNRTLASVQLEERCISRIKLFSHEQAAISWLSLSDFEELGASKADAEPLVDVLRSLTGVRVVCMLREQEDVVRGSFRAKDDTDVSVLAARFGGGGHKAAAGFTYKGSLKDAIVETTAAIEAALS